MRRTFSVGAAALVIFILVIGVSSTSEAADFGASPNNHLTEQLFGDWYYDEGVSNR